MNINARTPGNPQNSWNTLLAKRKMIEDVFKPSLL
jgi:hypothetical protein